jgi:hypothetical protein
MTNHWTLCKIAICHESNNSLHIAFLSKFLTHHNLLQISGAMVHRIMSNTTMPFSNMIGPVEQVEFYGHRIIYIAPSVYGLPSV